MYVVEALLRIIAGYFEQGLFGAFEIGEAGTTRDRRALRLMFADLVFADPPYDLKNLGSIPSKVREAGLLTEDGLLVLEHGKSDNFHGEEGFVEMRKYGHVHFSFFTFES